MPVQSPDVLWRDQRTWPGRGSTSENEPGADFGEAFQYPYLTRYDVSL